MRKCYRFIALLSPSLALAQPIDNPYAQAVVQAVRPCLPANPTPDVMLEVTLDQLGKVTHITIPHDAVEEYRATPAYRDAASRAMAAVMGCAPYRLPPKAFKDWEKLILSFTHVTGAVTPQTDTRSAEEILLQGGTELDGGMGGGQIF